MLQTLSNQIGIEMLAELAQVPEAAAKTLSKELSETFSFLFLTSSMTILMEKRKKTHFSFSFGFCFGCKGKITTTINQEIKSLGDNNEPSGGPLLITSKTI